MSDLFDATTLDATGKSATSKKTQLWKTHDVKANKTGPHHTVFWVKSSKEYKESQKLGVPAAAGVGKYQTSNKYAGEWVDNRKEGYGTLTKPNGDKYEGEWLDNKRHGRGTQWVRRGGKLRKLYTGDWDMGVRSGTGVFFYASGDRYEGEWQDNKRHGRGRIEYVNGDVYDGEWIADERDGVGVLILANGDQYEGHWKGDKKEGPGRLFYMTTHKMYEGEWVDDIAKCGVISDIPEELLSEADRGSSEDKFRLPELGLEDPDAVVMDAVESVVVARGGAGAGAGAAATAADLNDEELTQLREAFDVGDADGSGTVRGSALYAILDHLGLSPTEKAIDNLLVELSASRDSDITFTAFADCMARLRE